MLTEPLLGVAELAHAAGVKPRTLAAYLARGKCPAPDALLACGPVWMRETVAAWLAAREERVQRALEASERDVDALTVAVDATGWYRNHSGTVTSGIVRDETKPVAAGHEAFAHLMNGRRPGLEQQLRRSETTVRAQSGQERARREAAEIIDDEAHADRDIAVSQLGPGGARQASARMRAADTARRIAWNRTVNRTGDPDGIPF